MVAEAATSVQELASTELHLANKKGKTERG